MPLTGAANSGASGEVVLRLDQLAKRYGHFNALDQVSLDIYDGEFLTIVGPSGSGKTTLIRLLVGMETPSSGSIYLRGERINNVPANRRPTCMVFQSLALFPHRSVGQNIEFPLKIRGVAPAKRRQRALQLMSLLRLPESYYGRRVTECSGGERQRVALARALCFEPDILFFDEPLSALDYRLRKTLEKELKELHRRTGKTFVYITHSLEEAMLMSDRIAIMRAGRFEQIGAADDIYARPESRFVAEFMGEVNLFPVNHDGTGAVPRPSIDNIQVQASAELAQSITTALPCSDQMTFQATLMVRPEFVRFLAADENSDFILPGHLEEEFALGSRVQYTVSTAAGPVSVEKLREQRFDGRPGDPVSLGWNLADVHLIADEPSDNQEPRHAV